MEALILAGGQGTRLRQAVPDLPKPMAPIRNRPFLEYLMDYWIGQGVTRFILSVGYKHELIEAHFGSAYRACPIVYAHETSALGTGGGMLLGLGQTQGDLVLVLNGDTFFEIGLAELRAQQTAMQADVSVALRRIAKNDRYGEVVLDGQGRVSSFSAAATGGPGIINGGVYLLRPDAFRNLGFAPGDIASLEQDLFPALLQANKCVVGWVSEAKFIDIGIPDDYYRAADLLPIE